ncbi:hypothetical protein Tco_0820727 [Tanacetum coccineum]|uniref:Uncharacterized protein n=1 Tax=Tanacetum coccineum TaxID=301880 RepID=A0ABQ5AB70_9ASTR
MSLLTPSDIQYSAATQIWGCYRLVSEPSSPSPSCITAITYTSVYTDSESGMVFWGADEELSDDGPPRVIVYGYNGLLMQPSNPEEDPEEYDDDETKDGPVDYPIDGGEDGDDDDGDSSGDDADDEEEEEHPAPADSAVVVPTVELVSPPEGTEPVTPPPSTDITTTGARITVRLQASISLPPEAEVERLLAMPTPPPSRHISLLPPSAGEHLARCMTLSAHSSPPPVSSPLLPSSGCPTQIQTLRIASTQALVDAVTAVLHHLYYHHYDHFYTYHHLYEVGESSTTRPTRGQGVEYGFVSTLDAEERRRGIREVGYGIRDTWVDPAEAVPEIAPMTLGEANTRVTELTELHEHDTQDLYALLEDAQDRDSTDCGGLSQAVHSIQAHQTQLQLQGTLIETQHQVHETNSQMQQTEMAELRETNRRRKAHMVEILRVMRDMRREMGDMQAELLALREQRRRARQPGSDARVPDQQDASRDADSHI